jgi:MarR family
MPAKERKQALRQIELLRQRIEELGTVLNDLDESVVVLGKGIERGAPIIEALEEVGGTLTVPAMLETFEEFHAARQDLRVALLVIARREGTTASELARTLGISRQLASRLAAEAEKGA